MFAFGATGSMEGGGCLGVCECVSARRETQRRRVRGERLQLMLGSRVRLKQSV